mmetsp:Transcript_12598/g.45298  ORF Transcript_12598/g.45298 Transcript_12598/m.45298 type:complete len:386 (-) Transcript_12598:18-1175(-)
MHDVVDRRDRPAVVVRPVRAVLGRDEKRDEARVPVVRDEDDLVAVRPFALAKVNHERGFARRVRQQREPELVIAVHAVRVPVQTTDALVARVLHEDKVDAVVDLVEEANLVRGVEAPDRGVGARVKRAVVEFVLFLPELVHRGHDHDAVPALDELARERAAHVREAAGFGPRRDLGGHEHDRHRVLGLFKHRRRARRHARADRSLGAAHRRLRQLFRFRGGDLLVLHELLSQVARADVRVAEAERASLERAFAFEELEVVHLFLDLALGDDAAEVGLEPRVLLLELLDLLRDQVGLRVHVHVRGLRDDAAARFHHAPDAAAAVHLVNRAARRRLLRGEASRRERGRAARRRGGVHRSRARESRRSSDRTTELRRVRHARAGAREV